MLQIGQFQQIFRRGVFGIRNISHVGKCASCEINTCATAPRDSVRLSASRTAKLHQLCPSESKMTIAFIISSPRWYSCNSLSSQSIVRTCPVMQTDESRSKGFSKKPPPPPPSEASKRRQAAASRYDEMAAAGMPEYTVWMRLKEGGTAEEGEQMPWLPVGCISVPRSSQVADALFDVENDLMQGAIRLYPKLRDEPRENIQFGYQLRDFDDEDIRLAERSPTSGFQAALINFLRRLQNPLNSR